MLTHPHFPQKAADIIGRSHVMYYRPENSNDHRNLSIIQSLSDHELCRELLLGEAHLQFLIEKKQIRLKRVQLEAATRRLRAVVMKQQQRERGPISTKEVHLLHAIEESGRGLKRRLVLLEAKAMTVRNRQFAFVYRRFPKREEVLPEVDQSNGATRSRPPISCFQPHWQVSTDTEVDLVQTKHSPENDV